MAARRGLVNNDQNPLLDQWNEKHIEILKNKFNEYIQKTNPQRNGVGGIPSTVGSVGKGSQSFYDSGNAGLDKQAFMKVFADLKAFPKQVAESAFRLFDRDRSGYIDFREFCCGLSIICLSSTNEKIRFVFDLFDLDRDGFLNRSELRTLLETAVLSFRKFSSHHVSIDIDKQWIDHHLKSMIASSSNALPLPSPGEPGSMVRVDFFTFKRWAERSLNVYHLLNTFMLVPSPVKERKQIVDIIQSYERKHGDTMYALSYRWWEMWKEYTSQHQSTKDQTQYIELLKESLYDDQPEFVRNYLLPYYEELKEADINDVVVHQEDQYLLNNSMTLKREISRQRLTPRSDGGGGLDGDNPDILEDSQKIVINKKGLSHLSSLMKHQQLVSKRSLNYSQSRDEGAVQVNTSMEKQKIGIIDTPKRKRSFKSKVLQQLQQKSEQAEASVKDINTQPSIIMEEEVSHNELYLSQSYKFHSHPQNLHQAIDRPTEIDNTDIEGEHPGQLKTNLMLHRDFIMIPEEAWLCLQRWYGGGPSFPRKVIINNTIPTIELYPPLITSLLAGTDGHPVQDSARSLFVSIAMKLSEVFLKVCESFNYISTRDARLWHKVGGKDWNLITDLEKTLEDFIVKDGDVFMVEMKFGERWPRDEAASGEYGSGAVRDWRSFEVGDKIDVFDNNEWKIGSIKRIQKDKLMVHLLNENWKNDLVIPKDSDLIDRYGQHTLEMHFRLVNSLSQDDAMQLAGFSGLDNIGNTCYMNAVLQALFHTPLFREYYLSKQFLDHLKPALPAHPSEKKTSLSFYQSSALAQSFGDLILHTVNTLRNNKKDIKELVSVAPIAFKKVVNQELPMFYGSQQHDSQEFLSFFLDKISEDLNRVDKEELEKEKAEEAKVRSQSQAQSAQKQPEENIGDGGTGGAQDIKQETQQQETLNIEPVQQTLVENAKQQINIISAPQQQSTFQQMTANEQIYHFYFQPPITTNKNSLKTTPAKESENGAASGSNAQQLVPQLLAPQVSQFSIAEGAFAKINGQQITPLLLDPSLTEIERKAIEAWYKELKVQNSAVSDLFMGQQATTVQCQSCRHRSYAFENFYTLSLPLPYNSNAIFYVTVMKRSSPYLISQIVKFGVQIDKNAKLSDLMLQIEKLSSLKDSRMAVVELNNNKIYRIYTKEDDTTGQTVSLRQIYRRTNELTIYECPNRIQDMPVQPTGGQQKRLQRTVSNRAFKDLQEIKMGTIVDAQDAYNKWYMGIVMDRDFDYELKQYRVKVHFYEFTDKWDEWFKEGEGFARIAPVGTNAEEPRDKIIFMPMMHRKRLAITSDQPDQEKTEQLQYQIFGMPSFLSIGNWYTWEETYVEIITQVQRFVKPNKGAGTKSQRQATDPQGISTPNPILRQNTDMYDENISDDDLGEEKSSRMQNYDSSYFSKKMTLVDKKGMGAESRFNGPSQLYHHHNNHEVINDDSDYAKKQALAAHPMIYKTLEHQKSQKQGDLFSTQTPKRAKEIERFKIQGGAAVTQTQRYPQQLKSNMVQGQSGFHESLLMQSLVNQVKDQPGQMRKSQQFEIQRLPFTISIIDGETHLCALCLFKYRFATESKLKTDEVVSCKGCDIYQSNDKVKWILTCFKRLEVYIDWHDAAASYRQPLITSDLTCLQYLQQEKELQSGVPLSKCFDIYSKKDQIDDYQCDNCKRTTPAMVETRISRAPDILIVHLKRFSYQNGYLEKIEDLVNFPVNNLDVSSFLCSGFRKHHASKGSSRKAGRAGVGASSKNHTYDLYAVVNHIMYHNTGGGHYTSYISTNPQGDTQVNPPKGGSFKGNQLWFKCNDSNISRMDKTDIVSKDAYILFYKRKEFSASNIINFTSAGF